MNYWLEALKDSLDGNGLIDRLTSAEEEAIAKDLEMAARMESEAMGYLNIPNPTIQENATLKKELEKERNKKFCVFCRGKGVITEGCGGRWSTSRCDKCNGEGKI